VTEIILIHGLRFAVNECGTCGVIYVVPEIVDNNHRHHGGYSSCSNGHLWGWQRGGAEIDRLRQERDRLKQETAYKDDEIKRLEKSRNEAWEAGTKSMTEIKRLKKRASAGTCPCCNRTFIKLANHMSQKHPQFQADAGTKLVLFKKRIK
jgi:hypothetical protein